jgi:hypothetical protein
MFPAFNSGRETPLPPAAKDTGRDETTAQAALRLVMMMLGSAGLAADRSLFWTILSNYAKNGQGHQASPTALAASHQRSDAHRCDFIQN